MRLKSLINGVVLGDFISLHEPSEELMVPANDPIEELHGDIKYTPCQAELLRTNDIEVIDANIANDIEDDQYCEHSDKHKGALDNSVRYWKDHFNESTNRYKIPYMFDGSHSEEQMDTIRRKLMDFRHETCVDLVELPWEEKNEGLFANKYENVFWVSLYTISIKKFKAEFLK